MAYQIFNNGSNVKLQNNLMKGGLMLGNPVTNCYGDNGPSFDSANIIDMNTQINLYYWLVFLNNFYLLIFIFMFI